MSGNAWGTCADPGGTNPILCRNKCTPAGTTVVNRADCGEVAHLQGTCVKGDTSKTNIFWC